MKKILVFFIMAAVITFGAMFGIKLILSKKENVKEPEFKIQVEAIKNVVLIEDKNLKTWSLVDQETKIRPDSTLSTYGSDSGILLKLKKDLLFGLGGDSSAKIIASFSTLLEFQKPFLAISSAPTSSRVAAFRPAISRRSKAPGGRC